MFLELVIALILGILAGSVTGLFPGIHINLVAAGLLASLIFITSIQPIVLVIFIVAMAITHTFLDFIPSIFLGAPEEDSFLAVLPGHQLLQKGKGFEATVYTLYGSLTALPIILIFSIIFIIALPYVFTPIKILMPYILIFVSLYLIFREEDFMISLTVFLLAGFLGLLAFNLPVKEPMLPLLSGLFGISTLVISIKNKISIPKQKISPLKKIKIKRKTFLKSTLAAAISAPLCSFLPGIGSGHAAVIGSELTGNEKDPKTFLFLVGAINTIVMALSFITIYAIGRTRSGAAVAVQEILQNITLRDIALIIIVIFVSGFLAFVLGINISKLFAKHINKINYQKVSLIIIGILLIINVFLSNFQGLIVLITASSLGVFTILSRVRRINLMGALLIPTIIFYLTL